MRFVNMGKSELKDSKIITETTIYHYVEELIFDFQKYAKSNLDDKISDKEYIILMRIRYLKKVTQQDLAKQFNLTEGYVANLLRKMENKGFIERIENPENRRQKLVSLTNEGLNYTDYLYNIIIMWEKEITSQITDNEVNELKILLNKLTR